MGTGEARVPTLGHHRTGYGPFAHRTHGRRADGGAFNRFSSLAQIIIRSLSLSRTGVQSERTTRVLAYRSGGRGSGGWLSEILEGLFGPRGNKAPADPRSTFLFQLGAKTRERGGHA